MNQTCTLAMFEVTSVESHTLLHMQCKVYSPLSSHQKTTKKRYSPTYVVLFLPYFLLTKNSMHKYGVVGKFSPLVFSHLFGELRRCFLVSQIVNKMHKHLCGLIVRVRVVPRRTVVGDTDRRFDNLSGSHHQSHENCVSSYRRIIVCIKLVYPMRL